jgi:hypothetical protein
VAAQELKNTTIIPYSDYLIIKTNLNMTFATQAAQSFTHTAMENSNDYNSNNRLR